MIFLKFLLTAALLTLSVECFFDLQMDRLELLYQDDSFIDFNKLRVRKMNKTVRAIVGEVNLKQKIGNEVLVEGKMYKKQGS